VARFTSFEPDAKITVILMSRRPAAVPPSGTPLARIVDDQVRLLIWLVFDRHIINWEEVKRCPGCFA